MSIITEFSVPASAFALAHTFEETPDLTIEAERLATHSREWVMPFLWATGEDLDTFEAAMANDQTVAKVKKVDVSSGMGLYNVHWAESVMKLVDQIIDQHGIMLEAKAEEGMWYLKLRFLTRQRLSKFHTYFDENDYSFELLRLHEETAPIQREFDLTPAQREVLMAAMETGYFDVPRTTDINELAETLGVSSNAVSQRLRRATNNLVQNTLSVTSAVDGSDE